MAKGFFSSGVEYLAENHPLVLAVIIDLIMIIPYVDIIFTLYLQIKLWNSLGNEYFKWLNIAYDLTDLGFPFLDIFPLNTLTVIIVLIYNQFPKHNI